MITAVAVASKLSSRLPTASAVPQLAKNLKKTQKLQTGLSQQWNNF